VFRGCISHNNCDDGWDLYAKLETGPIQPVTVENCIAYSNGELTNGYKAQGDGNGFKLGGEGLVVKHVLRNCLSFRNASTGVTSNSDPAITVENTTSVDNGKANFEFSYYSSSTPQFSAKNNISFRTVSGGAADSFPAVLASSDNYFYNGAVSINSMGQAVLTSDFKSLTPTDFKRKIDGNVAKNDFMALTQNTPISGGFDIRQFSVKLISNPDFDKGIDGWHCVYNTALNARAETTWDAASGSLQTQCVTKGSSYTAIQLFTGPFNVEAGKLYLLTFKAKSSAAFAIPSIKLNQDGTPWSDYAKAYSNLAITTDWQDYAVIFKANTTAADGRLTFFLGNALPDGATFNIDALDLVSYQEIVVSPAVDELLPNPGFDLGVGNWNLYSDASAQANGGLDASDYYSAPVSYRIQCVNNGNSQNSIQLFTMPLNIVQNRIYELKFKAKSTISFTIPSIRLMKATSPWTNYATPCSGVNIIATDANTEVTHTIYFTANVTASDGRITFFLGDALPDGATFHIDSLSVRDMGTPIEIRL
ncbi:MAG TPA: carbohydrate binding domain-containing protein, partial [Bacillota bacterium]|nr:carbohydrate binding domain-containing protein [Bacillota bacterium]